LVAALVPASNGLGFLQDNAPWLIRHGGNRRSDCLLLLGSLGESDDREVLRQAPVFGLGFGGDCYADRVNKLPDFDGLLCPDLGVFICATLRYK
jgi:hypothetical protein